MEEFDEIDSIKKSISDIPECDCLCENSVERALLGLRLNKLETIKKVKDNRYLSTEDDVSWFMP